MRVASIGECMVELSETADGAITRAFGGDTLNTAVYLARLGVPVDYVTALGDDAWSRVMLAAWAAEGVGIGRVEVVPGRQPGLYVIRTDGAGERTFSYWRDSAPARDLFRLPSTPALLEKISKYDLVYFSGISLSLYGEEGRAKLFDAADRVRAAGGRIAFDTNFRPRGWPDRSVPRAAYAKAFARADIIFASIEDLDLLNETKGADHRTQLLAIRAREVVLKLSEPAVIVLEGGRETRVDAQAVAPRDVVDTTAAGDSFAAAYLAARLRGETAEAAARAGHQLAGIVIKHRGAIVPRHATAELQA